MSKVGRPPKYANPEELQVKIDEYFEQDIKIELERKPFTLTITGLVLYCGFCDRVSFYDYEKRPEFSYTIKRARARIEEHYEKRLQGNNCTGSIFALKNFGWIDKQETEHTFDESIVGLLAKALNRLGKDG